MITDIDSPVARVAPSDTISAMGLHDRDATPEPVIDDRGCGHVDQGREF